MMKDLLEPDEEVRLIDVAVPLPVKDPFTYRVPSRITETLVRGSRVQVPFRNRIITGYTVAVNVQREVPRARDIIEIKDPEAVLSEHHLRLAKWMSEYYFSSWGEALSNMIPKLMKRKRKAKLKPMARDVASPTIQKPFQLTKDQTTAFNKIKEALVSGTFQELFLFGVTGGGKSELYIRSMKEVLVKGKSAICLVPEIAITEQLKRFFTNHFDDELEILHSKLTDRERYDAWTRIRLRQKRIILGARSAIFAPAPDLGLIIMDEEQESGYKQDKNPRYHTREVARWRAEDLKIPFLLGTATPTLETMHRVHKGEVTLLTLPNRIDGAKDDTFSGRCQL